MGFEEAGNHLAWQMNMFVYVFSSRVFVLKPGIYRVRLNQNKEGTGDSMSVFEKIQQAVEQGDPSRVNKLIDQALLESDPDSQYTLAEWLSEIGYVEEAVKVLEHLQFLFPEESQLAIDRAGLLIEIDREDEALEALASIPEEDEQYPQALVALADLFQTQGLLEAAERRLNEAIRLMPDEPLLLQAKAELLLESGRYLESARIYTDLLETEAEIPGVSLSERLAEVYSAGAAYEEALPYYEQALKEQSSPDTLFGAAYSAFQSAQYETAIRYAEELTAMDPDYFSAYLLRAESLNMTGDYTNAYKAAAEGISRDEYDKELYLFAGKLALKLGMEPEGEEHLRQAIALDPEYMDAIQSLIAFLHGQERSEDVLELAEAAVSNETDWVALYPAVASAYEATEQYDKAAEYYESAYPSFRDDPEFLGNYARFLLEEGKQEQAGRVIDEILVMEPNHPDWADWRQSFQ